MNRVLRSSAGAIAMMAMSAAASHAMGDLIAGWNFNNGPGAGAATIAPSAGVYAGQSFLQYFQNNGTPASPLSGNGTTTNSAVINGVADIPGVSIGAGAGNFDFTFPTLGFSSLSFSLATITAATGTVTGTLSYNGSSIGSISYQPGYIGPPNPVTFNLQSLNLASSFENQQLVTLRLNVPNTPPGTKYLDNVQVTGTPVGLGNDSRIYVGAAPTPDGTSGFSASMGSALIGSTPPGASQSFQVNKTGNSSTTFSVGASPGISAGAPDTSFAAGNQTRTVNFSLGSGQNLTPGFKSYLVSIHNVGNIADGDDLISVSTNIYTPASIAVNAPLSSYDSGQSFTITSAGGANFYAPAEIRRTLSGASAADWSLSGLANATNSIAPGATLTITPQWIGGNRPNGTYTATINLSANNELAIAGAALGDVSLNKQQITLSHTISNSSGGSVPVPSGGSYQNFGATSAGGTSAKILYGTASTSRNLTIQSVPGSMLLDAAATILGDGVQIDGIDGDVYVLELSFPPTPVLPPGITAADLMIVSRPGATGAMELAVAANTSGTYPPAPILSSFSDYLLSHPTPVIGDYGVDETNHTIWAVLNHNSQFAVAVVPEPACIGLLGTALLTISRLRR